MRTEHKMKDHINIYIETIREVVDSIKMNSVSIRSRKYIKEMLKNIRLDLLDNSDNKLFELVLFKLEVELLDIIEIHIKHLDVSGTDIKEISLKAIDILDKYIKKTEHLKNVSLKIRRAKIEYFLIGLEDGETGNIYGVNVTLKKEHKSSTFMACTSNKDFDFKKMTYYLLVKSKDYQAPVKSTVKKFTASLDLL